MTERQLRARRRIVLIYLYCLWGLWGVYGAFTAAPIETESEMRLASNTFLAMALAGQLGFMWFCTLDARLVGKSLPRLARFGIFLFPPYGVPIYLVWARRWRGVGLLLLHLVLLHVVLGGVYLIVLYLCYGSSVFR